MAYTAKIIEIFLSSPSDVTEERQLLARLANEWNQLRSRDTGCYFSILTWENIVAPALASRVQENISNQIGFNYDVYLGLMWARLGTPTGKADSGTVEEFDDALKILRSERKIWIAMLFKTSPIDFDQIDPDQIAKVKDFKQRLALEGALYREFSDENSLRAVSTILFEQIVKDLKDNLDDSISLPLENAQILKAGIKVEIVDEEIGLIEIGEQFTAITHDFVDQLQSIMAREEINNIEIAKCTEDLATATRYGTLDADIAKKIIHRSSKSLKSLADYLEVSIDLLEDKTKSMSRLISLDLRIRAELNGPAADAKDTMTALLSLEENIDTAVQSFHALIKATNNLPSLSTELVKSRNRLSRVRQSLIDQFLALQLSINNSIKSFREVAGSLPAPTATPNFQSDILPARPKRHPKSSGQKKLTTRR